MTGQIGPDLGKTAGDSPQRSPVAMTPNETDLIPLPPSDEALVPAHRLPAHIGVANQTLARWRYEGQGPKFVKVGRRVAYRAGDVRAWLHNRTYAHTAQATASSLAA